MEFRQIEEIGISAHELIEPGQQRMNRLYGLDAFNDAPAVTLLEQFKVLLLPTSEDGGLTGLRHDVLVELYQGVHQIPGAVLRYACPRHFRLVYDFVRQLDISQLAGNLQHVLVDFAEICLVVTAKPARNNTLAAL